MDERQTIIDAVLVAVVSGGILLVLLGFVMRYLRAVFPWLHYVATRRYESDDLPVVSPVADRCATGDQPIATGATPINDELRDNAVVPADARDIIRYQAKIETLAALIKDGQISNTAKAIERAFGCARSSSTGSVYQKALLAINALNDKPVYPALPAWSKQGSPLK